MIKYLKLIFLAFLVVFISSDTVFAVETGGNEEQTTSAESQFDNYFEEEKETYEERRVKDYDDLMHYQLMSHADESWWDVASKTGNNILVGVRDFAWATYTVVAELVTTIVYHMFNVDLLEMLTPNLTNFASSTAGQIVNNILILGIAFVGITITFRGLIKQDWAAFFKILLLMIISLGLLFSIQSKQFNYIGLVDSISKDIENTLIATPPSLLTGEEINYGTTDNAINMENRIYNALLLQPYLDLQYGDTNVSRINADRGEGYQVYDYLDSSPFTEDGQENRDSIAEYEFEDMENNNVNSASASSQIGKVVMYFISLCVQGFIYIFLAAIRYMLQIGMIIALVMLPIVLFLSLFPSFEKITISYVRKIFQLVLYKAILVFYMIFVMSIMQITYTIQDYGMVQAMVFQIVLAISCILIYFYRNSALDTVSDSSSVSASEASGSGVSNSMSNLSYRYRMATANKQNKEQSQHGKDFKNSDKRGASNKYRTDEEDTKSSMQHDTNVQDNQQSNTRDNVTNFSDYQNKKQQEENEKQENKINNNQEEVSKRNQSEESHHRNQSENKQSNQEKSENQHRNQDTQRSDTRNVDTNRNSDEQHTKNNQQDHTESKHRKINNQKFESKNSKQATERLENTAKNPVNTKPSESRNSTQNGFTKSNESKASKKNTEKPVVTKNRESRNRTQNDFTKNTKPNNESKNQNKPSSNRNTKSNNRNSTRNNEAFKRSKMTKRDSKVSPKTYQQPTPKIERYNNNSTKNNTTVDNSKTESTHRNTSTTKREQEFKKYQSNRKG